MPAVNRERKHNSNPMEKKTLVFTVHRPGTGRAFAGGLRRNGGFE